MIKNLVIKQWWWLIVAAWIYTFTFVFNHYWSKYASYESVTASFQKKLTQKEAEFDKWAADSSLISQLAEGDYTANQLLRLQQLPFQVFIYQAQQKTGSPVFWSTNAVLPSASNVALLTSGSFVRYGNGQYELLKRTVTTSKGKLLVIGLVLLHQEFFIENESLRKEYPDFPGLEGKMVFTSSPTKFPIIGEQKQVLAYFKPNVPQPLFIFNSVSIALEWLVFLLLCIFITRFATSLMDVNKVWKGLLFFGLSVALLRWMVLEFGLPLDLSHIPGIAHQKWQSNKDDSELIRVFFNAILGLWVALFIGRKQQQIRLFLLQVSSRYHWILIGLASFLMVGIHYFLLAVIRNLYLNSSVAFDLTNFFSLDYTTVFSFIILFVLSLGHFLLIRFLAAFLHDLLKHHIIRGIIIIAITGLVLLSAIFWHPLAIPLLFSLVWLLLFYWLSSTNAIKRYRLTAGAVIIGLFTYAFSLSLLLSILGEGWMKTRAYSLGRSLLMQKDGSSEYLVRIAASSMTQVNWDRVFNECNNGNRCDVVKDSLASHYFSGYLNRYNSKIYLFNHQLTPLGQQDGPGYESLNTLYATQGEPTGNPDMAYFEESYDRFGYIIKKEIFDKESNQLMGYLFVVIRYLSGDSKTFSPELFQQLQDFAVDLPQGFSYAWYQRGVLLDQYRSYPYPANLPPPLSEKQSIWENNTSNAYELWLWAGPDTVLALAVEQKILVRFLSLMAYLFGAFVLFSIIFALLFLFVKRIFSGRKLLNVRRVAVNLQNKIRGTVIGILLVSFFIVAVVTISFFMRQFTTGNHEKLAASVQKISTELMRQLPPYIAYYPLDQQWKTIEDKLLEITRGLNMDANCFDNEGRLAASTQPVIFEKSVISSMMNPEVWWNLNKGTRHRYLASEKIGKLTYTSIYQPLRNDNNQIFGYIQVPYFASQSELNREISNFLVILINIIALIFLLSGGVAFWISGSITRSFDIIASKMDRIRLSEKNERIEWTRNDEIGGLVNQYNKMVDQLEESARMMARNERELAWREMARQVAHEIKNPLTPMKLSLQFLQKAILQNKPDVQQITERVAGNLVGQIDHLSAIATEFSQFANLGQYQPDKFDLHDTLREVVLLYELQEHLSIRWNMLPERVMIMADKTQINRLFTNLFQNAIEAVKPNQNLTISINESREEDKVMIAFRDNGTGIDEEIQARIFTPNFTTKSSGTGLGLAMCKVIVENANGSIRFETEAGVGTVFYIELPLAS